MIDVNLIKYADLHLHTTFSDGTYTPSQLVKACIQKNISVMSITDHDTINGVDEAKNICASNGIRLINGIELSAEYDGEEVHILCYDFKKTEDLQIFLKENIVNKRHERNVSMIREFNKIGIPISFEALSILNKDTLVTRAHVATYLYENNYTNSFNEAFTKYLTKGASTYVGKIMPKATEIIEFIRKIGGVSSLAHPNMYTFWKNNPLNGLKKFKKMGIDAVECYHSSLSYNDTNMLLGYVSRLGLCATSGSDFHGDNKKHVSLGCTNTKVSDLKPFLDKIDKFN